MSQHEFYPKHLRESISVVVGWDPALGTYYAQIRDYKISQDDDCVIIWLTPAPGEIQTVKQLEKLLNQRIGDKILAVRIPWHLRWQLTKNKKIEGSAW